MNPIFPDARSAILLPAAAVVCGLAGLLLLYSRRRDKNVFLKLAGRLPGSGLLLAAQPYGDTGGAGAPRVSKGRVLVLEDEEVVQKVLKRMLDALGYDAEMVTTGEHIASAWEAAMTSGRPFTAAILDLTIPGGMGGAEAVLRLKALDPSARAIVTSGYPEDPVMTSCEAYGFDCCLAKPYQLDSLEEALSRTRGA